MLAELSAGRRGPSEPGTECPWSVVGLRRLRLRHGETPLAKTRHSATLLWRVIHRCHAAPALFRVETLAGKRSRNRSACDASAKQNTAERRKPPAPARTGRKPQGRTSKRASGVCGFGSEIISPHISLPFTGLRNWCVGHRCAGYSWLSTVCRSVGWV